MMTPDVLARTHADRLDRAAAALRAAIQELTDATYAHNLTRGNDALHAYRVTYRDLPGAVQEAQDAALLALQQQVASLPEPDDIPPFVGAAALTDERIRYRALGITEALLDLIGAGVIPNPTPGVCQGCLRDCPPGATYCAECAAYHGLAPDPGETAT